MFVLVISEALILPYVLSTGIRIQNFEHFSQKLKQPLEIQNIHWTEKFNLINLDNAIIARRIDELINALNKKNKTYQILAINMGLIPDYLRSRHGQNVHFIDLYGLVTDDVTRCPLFSKTKRSALGVMISYEDYFNAQKSQAAPCALAKPDIIYEQNLDGTAIDYLKSQGYKVVYQQTGKIRNHGLFYMRGDYYIAITNALYQQLPEPLKHRSYHFAYQGK